MGLRGDDPRVEAVEREVAMLLRRARVISVDIARAVHPGLDPAVFGLLSRLADSGGERAADVAVHFGLDKSTVSRQVAVLLELGLVAREPLPGDARSARLVLTPEGVERLTRARAGRLARFRALLGAWDDVDVEQLAASLHRLNAAWE